MSTNQNPSIYSMKTEIAKYLFCIYWFWYFIFAFMDLEWIRALRALEVGKFFAGGHKNRLINQKWCILYIFERQSKGFKDMWTRIGAQSEASVIRFARRPKLPWEEMQPFYSDNNLQYKHDYSTNKQYCLRKKSVHHFFE